MISKFTGGWYLYILVFLIGVWPGTGYGQSNGLSDSIEYYAHELVRNHELNVRVQAFNYLNNHLGDFMEEYSYFKDTFPRFEGLAVLENTDHNLRIVTYELYRDTSSYEYGGWIQSNRLDEPVLLTDGSMVWEDDGDLDYLELSPDNWYGVLYYEMMPLSVSDNSMTFLLFGRDNYHLFTKRKVLETLVIQNDTLHFGRSVIEMEKGLPEEYRKKRFIIDYSVQAPATLRYDPHWDKIIFDHLVFMPGNIPEQRIMRVPDGTYSGFEIDEENQKLVFIDKVFHQVMDEAPGGRNKSEPKRDLFGNLIENR